MLSMLQKLQTDNKAEKNISSFGTTTTKYTYMYSAQKNGEQK